MRQITRRHVQRAWHFTATGAVGGQAIFRCTARADKLIASLAFDDQAQITARIPLAGKRRAQRFADFLIQRQQWTERLIADIQLLQRAALTGDRLRRETAPAQHAHDFFQRRRCQIRAVLPRRQGAQWAAEKLQLLASLAEALGETFAAPVMPGVAGFHRFTVLVEQAEIEVEAVRLMPAKRPR
ncbi:hypothetical protein D3C86_1053870 [compost metagenome]